MGFLPLADNKMTPKSLVCLCIIGRKSAFSSKLVKDMIQSIDSFIAQHAVVAIDDTVELSCRMKTKSICLMDSFTPRDVFSPAKLDLIAVAKNFWRCFDRVPRSMFGKLWSVMKYFSYLLFFYLQLLLVGDRQPSASSVYLKMLWEYLLKRGFFYYGDNLSFDTI